jgi:cytidine deaminase
LPLWDAACRQAMRSTFKRHRTGAIIDWENGHIGRGCSYKHDGSLRVNSIHAERAATMPPFLYGRCIVVTLTRVGNFANCSRPCYDCAKTLQKYMLKVVYAERTNNGGWAIREVPFDLLTEGYLKPTKYA